MATESDPTFDVAADAEPLAISGLDGGSEPQTILVPPALVEPTRPSTLFLVGSLVGGNGISLVLRLLGGILQARCVLPDVLGLYNSIGLVLGYTPFLQLGISNGINRELPYFVGKGDRKRVLELAASAQAWALAVGGVVAAALSCIGCWHLIHGHWQYAAGWFTNAVLGILFFYNTDYLQMTYRTGHDFARLALASVVESSVALVLVALVALLNFYGLCLRAVLAAVVSAALLHYWRPVRVGPHWNLQHLRHLLTIGAPIFVVGQIYSWWTVLNSTLVFAFTGDNGLGLYSMVLVAGGAYELLPTAVGQVLYPRMAEQYGRTGRIRDLVRMAIKPTILSVLLMIPAVAVGCLLVEPVTRLILPNYVGAVPAIRWALLVAVVQCLMPVNNVYNVVRRQDLYVVAIILGMGAYFASLLWLVRGGAELTAFPQAMLIGRLVFALSSYFLVLFLLRTTHPAQ